MKRIKYILLALFFVFLGINNNISAQERRLKKADEIFEAEEYYKAMQEYSSIMRKIKDKSQKNELYYKIGECYYMITDYKKARSNYRRSAKDKEFEYISTIRLAEIEIQLGNFDEAIKYYNEVLEKYPNDSIALKGIESANLSLEWLNIPTRYSIEKVKDFNTRRNDFSPSVDEKSGFDHVYFSSTRDESKGKRKSSITGEKFSDLYLIKFERNGKWSDIIPLDSLNTEYDEGTPCVFDQGKKFYFTSCRAEKGKKVGCQIFEAQKVDGEWMNATNLNIVSDTISIGHPTVSVNGDTLFFSARMQGGYGGADIWYVIKEEGAWSKPKNIGPAINSRGDELFPFMRTDGTLYYSSTKHPTMGGLDIFIAKKNEKDKWVSENLKPPFNSNGNDFGIYVYSNEEKGYFTSDRKGSKGEDIFMFEKKPLVLTLTGTVKDVNTDLMLDSCIVFLYGSDGTSFKDTTSLTENEGKFNFKLKPNTDYVFLVTKEGYFNGKGRFSTVGEEFDKTFNYDIQLETLNKIFEIPNIEFEFGKWELNESSKITLDSIARILYENPNIIIELSAHTDMIGSEEDNIELSQKRASSVMNYIKSKGIPEGRLTAVGYGESKPKVITKYDPRFPFLPEGTVLTEEFIMTLTPEQQVVANQQNRRVEMRVIGNDYVPSLD